MMFLITRQLTTPGSSLVGSDTDIVGTLVECGQKTGSGDQTRQLTGLSHWHHVTFNRDKRGVVVSLKPQEVGVIT